ncbi:pectin lyase fold/virulence factor [Xylogone sp. PMI_703]|nr:pectin lyase fold/virulence factor [Xylogone sp. PMI_703]
MLELFVSLLFATTTFAQLIGPVGPRTPLQQKSYECNILDYGAVADNQTDVADAIEKAFEQCVKLRSGSRLIVPGGHFLATRAIVLENGTNWAFQLDGLVTAAYGGSWNVSRELVLQGFAGASVLNDTINGEGDDEFLLNVLTIINAEDFEFYSSNGLGAIQGQGFLYRLSGNTSRPRLVRLISPLDASIHDLILVDSPKFHFVFDYGTNIEIYHLTIRGADLGSYDGIDAVGTNYYIHDNEVTNRDECVSVKSPSHYVLIENQVCNRVGSGLSIGSLNVSAEISNIYARNISVIEGNEIAFIKTYPGGSGYVTNITWENFRSKASLYGLNINQYWQNTLTPDTGAVSLSNLVFRNFSGSVADGAQRPPLNLIANDLTFALNVTVEDFSVWTESGSSVVNKINNVFGVSDSVYGPNDGISSLASGATPTTYTSKYTITTPPPNWTSPSYPTWAAPTTGYGTTDPIPVYTPAPLWRPQGDYNKHYWGSF